MNELLTSYEWSRRVVNEFGMRGERDRRSPMNELLRCTEWSRESPFRERQPRENQSAMSNHG